MTCLNDAFTKIQKYHLNIDIKGNFEGFIF